MNPWGLGKINDASPYNHYPKLSPSLKEYDTLCKLNSITSGRYKYIAIRAGCSDDKQCAYNQRCCDVCGGTCTSLSGNGCTLRNIQDYTGNFKLPDGTETSNTELNNIFLSAWGAFNTGKEVFYNGNYVKKESNSYFRTDFIGDCTTAIDNCGTGAEECDGSNLNGKTK